MDEIRLECARLISLIENERVKASKCFQGDILKAYQNLLNQEVERIQELSRLIEKFI